MRIVLCAAALAAVVSCKSAPEPAPEPVAPPPAAVDAGPVAAPAAPPEPEVTLAAAPDMPKPVAPLTAVEPNADSPTTNDTVELGHLLFFDKAMSKDGSMACVDCHVPAKGWATNNALDAKVGGAMNKRNTPTVLNLGYHPSFYWDGRMPTLEAVCNAAWKGQLGADPAGIATALNAKPEVKARFKRAYNEVATADNVPKALASFLRTLTNADSAFDKFNAGDKKALSADAQKGFELFKKTGCVNCHVLPLMTDVDFHHVGIESAKPEDQRDHGRKDATKSDRDEGKFKTPSLRNVALTAPYFHDGSAATLEAAIDVMAAGGAGPKDPLVDPNLKPAKLSAKEKAQLKAFLESLTGTSSVNGP